MFPSACHSHITSPVLTSICWITESVRTPFERPVPRGEVHAGSGRTRRSTRCRPARGGSRAGRRGSRCPPARGRSAGSSSWRSRIRPGRSRPRGSAPATRSAPAGRRTATTWKLVADSPAGTRFEPDQVAFLVGDHRPRACPCPGRGRGTGRPARHPAWRACRSAPWRASGTAPSDSAGPRPRCPG